MRILFKLNLIYSKSSWKNQNVSRQGHLQQKLIVVVGVVVVKGIHSYPTLCNPKDCSPLGSSVHGILQTRILEWVAMSSSRGSSQPRDQIRVSCVSCIGSLILHHCATWEAPKQEKPQQ